MRRAFLALLGVGIALILLALPLWRVTRTARCSGSGVSERAPSGVPCDPRLYLPFGDLALGITVVGLFAILTALGVVAVWIIGRARALDAAA